VDQVSGHLAHRQAQVVFPTRPTIAALRQAFDDALSTGFTAEAGVWFRPAQGGGTVLVVEEGSPPRAPQRD
jgi:hypothetical protein